MIAGGFDSAADRIDGLEAYLRQRDVRELLGELEDFGRTRPALFLGACSAAGFMLARFLKSSSRARSTAEGAASTEMSSAVRPPTDEGVPLVE